MTDDDLRAIEQRLGGLPPEPWEAQRFGTWNQRVVVLAGLDWVAEIPGGSEGDALGSFIAHARADVPALLGECRAMLARAEKAETLAQGLERDVATLNAEGVRAGLRVHAVARERDATQARAEKAEAIAAAERALRKAIVLAEEARLDLASIREEGEDDASAVAEVDRCEAEVTRCEAALRALGVEP